MDNESIYRLNQVIRYPGTHFNPYGVFWVSDSANQVPNGGFMANTEEKIITSACEIGKHHICIGYPGGFCRCECHEKEATDGK